MVFKILLKETVALDYNGSRDVCAILHCMYNVHNALISVRTADSEGKQS